MKSTLLILVAILALLDVSACAGETTDPRSPGDWQVMAGNDLDAIHAAIVSNHPGVIDTMNPGFNRWVEVGYRKAKALIPQVVSYDTALFVVHYYTTGFLDDHLFYSDDARHNYPIIHAGWSVDFNHGKYLVAATLPNWPVAQPPLGAELVTCDGRSPNSIIRRDIAPFENRHDDSQTRQSLAQKIGLLHLSGLKLRSCRFRTTNGAILKLRVSYRPVSTAEYFSTLTHVGDASIRPTNSFALQDGVLWIRAGNFQLKPGTSDESDLEAMLKALPKVTGAKRIVFDVRGNKGGDSSIGNKIFDAATGGLDYDRTGLEKLPRLYAQWRVSDMLLAKATKQLALNKRLYGANDEKTVESQKFLDEVNAAIAAGDTWIEQDSGDHRITRADISARHGKLRRYEGRVMLVTDAGCVSACLDFADLVLQVPGAIQLGQTTGSDTVYIDVGSIKLPSGNHLDVPLKVWRNRLRGNNEALKPDIPLKVDIGNDAAVRQAVLSAVP